MPGILVRETQNQHMVLYPYLMYYPLYKKGETNTDNSIFVFSKTVSGLVRECAGLCNIYITKTRPGTMEQGYPYLISQVESTFGHCQNHVGSSQGICRLIKHKVHAIKNSHLLKDRVHFNTKCQIKLRRNYKRALLEAFNNVSFI